MRKRWLYIPLVLPFIIGLIIGSFKDLEIAESVYWGVSFADNPFGMLCSAFAPIISYMFLTFVSGYFLYFATIEKENNWLKAFYWFVGTCAYAVSIFFTQDKIISVNSFDYSSLKIPGIFICALFLLPFYFIGYKTAKKKQNKTFLFACIALLFVYGLALVPATQFTKWIIRRPRYRTLDVEEYKTLGVTYLNWWQRNPLWKQIKEVFADSSSYKEDFKSFPSGHTCEACMVAISLPYLGTLDQKHVKREPLYVFIGLAFTIMVGFSRMTMGAHFLSDVSMGALIMSVLFVIANEINLRFVIKE